MSAAAPSVEEIPWWLDVNGERIVTGTVSPEQIEALAVGRLVAEGFARGAADIRSLSIIHDPPGCRGAQVTVDEAVAATAQAELAHRRAHGCGVRHFITCDPKLLRRPRQLAVPPIEEFAELFRSLFAATDQRHPEGGVHAAALTDGRELRFHTTDVGRHNAVDKVIGQALLEREQLGRLGLVVSARISAEMAAKAARAGLAWAASRSVPTDLAVEVARAAALPLVARAPGRHAHLFDVEAHDRSHAADRS